MNLRFHAPVLVALTALVSCVDLAPSKIPPVRWLTIAPPPTDTAARTSEPNEPRLWIGRVTTSDAIGVRLVRRSSAYEVRYDEFARWAEQPISVLERALDDELFRSGPFVRDDREGRRLDVELAAFEERLSPRHTAAVTLLVRVVEPGGTVLLDRRFEANETVDGEDPALVAQALTGALYSALRQLSDRLELL